MNEPIPSPYQEKITQLDHGHMGLVEDVDTLFIETNKYAFHDYKGKKYPMPKVALVAILEKMISRAKAGYYDNKNIV